MNSKHKELLEKFYLRINIHLIDISHLISCLLKVTAFISKTRKSVNLIEMS